MSSEAAEKLEGAEEAGTFLCPQGLKISTSAVPSLPLSLGRGHFPSLWLTSCLKSASGSEKLDPCCKNKVGSVDVWPCGSSVWKLLEKEGVNVQTWRQEES